MMDFLSVFLSFYANTKRKIHSFELHPARITVNKAANAVGKSCDFMQLPLPPGRKNILYGIPFSGRIRKQINDEFIHKVVVE